MTAKIFCLMGKSGCGKDSVFRELLKDTGLALKPAVGFTTRPKRLGEENGRDYYFFTEQEFARLQKQGKVIESRVYETARGKWRYGTVDNRFFYEGGGILAITTLESFVSFKEYFGENNVVPLYLHVDDGVRLQRALNRERKQKNPDYTELCRRFLADNEDFSAEKLKKSGVLRIFKNVSFKKCVAEIKKEIRENRS